MKKIIRSIIKFFIGLRKEIKKIKWPNRKNLIKYSIATIGCVFVMGIYFSLLNFLFSFLVKVGI